LDLAFGQKYENEFQKIVEGTVEVKADRLWQKTSNVFIEIESRQKPSGIAVSTARYWVFFLEVAKRKDQIFVGIPLVMKKNLKTLILTIVSLKVMFFQKTINL